MADRYQGFGGGFKETNDNTCHLSSGGQDACLEGSQTTHGQKNRFYIHVPYWQGEDVEALGGKYDKEKNLWYYTEGKRGNLFQGWEPVTNKDSLNLTEWVRALEKEAEEEPDCCYFAKFDLAKYYYGMGEQGFPRNLEKAFSWMEKASKSGCIQAHLFLGEMYQYGRGTTIDLSKAVKHYEEGLYRFLNKEVEEKPDFVRDCEDSEAAKSATEPSRQVESAFLEEAQRYLCAEYMKRLGILYEEDGSGFQDEQKSIEWLKKASCLGNLWARYHLAVHYYYGRGIEKNRQKALALLKNVSEAGSPKNQVTRRAKERLGSWSNGDLAA